MTRGAFAAGRACASSEVLADTRNVILTLCCRDAYDPLPENRLAGGEARRQYRPETHECPRSLTYGVARKQAHPAADNGVCI